MKRVLLLFLALSLLGIPGLSLGNSTPPNRMVVQVSTEPECMDPSMNEFTAAASVLSNLFCGLMKYDADEKLVPGLAEKVDLSEDGLVYTFTLREGLLFSDGSPLTAHDFYFTWMRTLDPEIAAANSFALYDIQNARQRAAGEVEADQVGLAVLDDLTLQVTLGGPAPWFLQLLANSDFFAIKQEVAEANPDDPLAWSRSAETYISNGPFRVKEFQPKSRYILEKNPYYYNADAVQLEELEYVFLASNEAALIAFENREVDVLTSINATVLSLYQDSPNFFSRERPGMRYYHFNTTKEPLNDARVRRALSLAIDRQIITEAIRQSGEPPLYGFLPDAIMDLADPDQSWREVHGNAFDEDVALAQQLLADAGYPGGEGFPSISIVQRPRQEETDVAQAMQAMWKTNLGIDIEVKTYEDGIYWDECDKGNFEIAFTGRTAEFMDPLALLLKFESANNRKESRWTHEEYDRILAETRETGDPAVREELFTQAEAILAEEYPCMPVYSYVGQHVVQDGVQGLLRPNGSHIFYEYATKE